MLRPRLIPCLLLQQGGLVKTVQFKNPKYVGDPINAVKIFNEKEADELIFLDIDASRTNKEPDYKLIKQIANECRMPLCYGGGIKILDQAKKIIQLGVEKIAISSTAVLNPQLITEMSKEIGSQSVVVVIDVKYNMKSKSYNISILNNQKEINLNPLEFAKECQSRGAGEIVLNFVDLDGAMEGYNIQFSQQIINQLQIPLTILGGAGKLEHIKELYRNLGNCGAAAGSLFVFKGVYKAVLINYPEPEIKHDLMQVKI